MPGQCILLPLLLGVQLKKKNFTVDLFFFTLLLQFHLTQFVALTLTLSHSVSCQSVLQVSCTQMALHL